MSEGRDVLLNQKLERMSLPEKVGQLLTFTWRGGILTPSSIEQITRLHAGGLCLEPFTLETCKNLYWGNSQYDPTFQQPPDYYNIAHTYFDPHNHGVSVTPEELTDYLIWMSFPHLDDTGSQAWSYHFAQRDEREAALDVRHRLRAGRILLLCLESSESLLPVRIRGYRPDTAQVTLVRIRLPE